MTDGWVDGHSLHVDEPSGTRTYTKLVPKVGTLQSYT